jgi:hypothetical protein
MKVSIFRISCKAQEAKASISNLKPLILDLMIHRAESKLIKENSNFFSFKP